MSGQAIFETRAPASLAKEANERESNKPEIGLRWAISATEAAALAKQQLGPEAELLDHEVRAYSEERIGFLGSHLRLTVRARYSGGEDELLSYFVKTLPRELPGLAAYIEEKGCFRKEVGFVELLLPLLLRRYNGEPWTARCWLAKPDTLVFEDLKLQGFANKPRFFDLPTMSAAMTCLARLHACSLLAEEQLGGKRLDKLYPELMEETEFRREGRSHEWFVNAVNCALWLGGELGLDTSRTLEASERVFEACVPSSSRRNVLSHGDLWSSNLLFDRASERCRLVDFQLIRYAPLAHDLAQLLYLCAGKEFRRRHEAHLLEHYYASLRGSLMDSGYRGVLPSWQEVIDGLEEQRLPGIVTAVIFHPTTLMDGKTAARIMNQPESYEAYYFRDRVPFVKEIMDKDKEYAAIITENVQELVEMSRKLDELPRPT